MCSLTVQIKLLLKNVSLKGIFGFPLALIDGKKTHYNCDISALCLYHKNPCLLRVGMLTHLKLKGPLWTMFYNLGS